MIDVSISADITNSAYRVPITIGDTAFGVKLDTGAKFTVISAKVFNSELTEVDLKCISGYCDAHCGRKEKFVSVSGHVFYGYLVNAHNVKVDEALLKDFYYYLVVENKRDIALLGFDFIKHCSGSFKMHDKIVFNKFDQLSYRDHKDTIENDEIIAFMDTLS